MQTTHHMLRIEPSGPKVYTLEELTQLLQIKILLLFISLYQLGAKHASALPFTHSGAQLWQLLPSFTEC